MGLQSRIPPSAARDGRAFNGRTTVSARAVLPLLVLTTVGLATVRLLARALFVPVATVVHFAGRLIGVAGSCFFQFVGFFLVFQLEKVGYIEEGVAFKSYVDKCRLHAGQDARDPPVVNGTGQCVFIFAFVIDFRELIVFKDCKPRLMRRAGDANLFCHRTFPPSGVCLLGPAARRDGKKRDRKGRGCAKGMTCEWPARRKSRSSKARGAVSRCDCSDRQAVRVGDPNAEILWPILPMCSAGPLIRRLLHGRTACIGRRLSAPIPSRVPCNLHAACGFPVSACS